MNETRILIALELGSYREAIAEVLAIMLPEAEVALSEPDDLERKVALSSPVLVLTSRVTGALEEAVPFWVEMYRGHGPLSTIKTPERRWEVEGLELSDLASVLSLLRPSS